MSNTTGIGNRGEALAADFLRSKGFEILARNYRYGRAEIDLIVRKENWLLFVEVKTRSAVDFGEPEDFVDQKKMNRIIDAAEQYIFATDWLGHIRFDIVSVKLGWETEILHLEDAMN